MVKIAIVKTFPTKEFNRYIREQGLRVNMPGEHLTDGQRRLIFLRASEEFYEYKLSLDGLSGIGEFLWSTMEGRRTSELAEVLIAAGELNFYVRAVEEGNDSAASTLRVMLAEVCEFYKRHKHELGL